MNDQDCIRKAAGVAGWSIDSNTLTGRVFIELPQLGREKNLGLSANWRDIEDSVARDALAAELVRQVLATNKAYMIETLGRNRDFTTKFFFYGEKTGPISDDHPEPIVISGKDHTMNTIKAIVDSGVLATVESGER